MKHFIGHAPFFRILLFVILGILLQSVFHVNLFICLGAFFFFLSISIYLIFYKNHEFQYRNKYLISFFTFGFISVVGICMLALQDIHIQKSYFPNFISSENYQTNYKILLNSDIIKTKKGVRCTAKVIAVEQDSLEYKTNGTINLFFEDTASYSAIKYGDIVSIQSKINEINEAKNPHEFDAKIFYANKDIYYQSFVKSSDFIVVNQLQCSRFSHWVYDIRHHISSKFEKHLVHADAVGVCKALILGIEEDIDITLLKAYASCGVIHVLSVSGLHVGVFYIIISFLFSLIKSENKKLKWTKAIISLALIWFYSLLSGFSPSVLRSAVMLTTVILAGTLDRKISIYNSLAASCFILLCFHAKYIFDVGFQLSYIAVLGIVYVQPMIYNWFAFKNKIANYFWNMTAASLSAQLTTFPLSVYYFYQFPVLFLFANLLVIPIISLALPLGFVFMFFCLFGSDTILHYIAIPIEWTLLIANYIILFFDKIPFNSLRPVYFTTSQLIIVYITIILFFVALELKNTKWFIAFQSLLLAVFVWFVFEKYQYAKQEKLVVLNINNTQRIELIQGNTSEVYTSKIDTAMNIFKVRPFHIFSRVSRENYTITKDKNFELSWESKNIAIINTSINNNVNLDKYDYIVVGNKAIDTTMILSKIRPKQKWIFDSSNSMKYIEQLKELKNFSFQETKTDKAIIFSL
jgi:competence protein ComEC